MEDAQLNANSNGKDDWRNTKIYRLVNKYIELPKAMAFKGQEIDSELPALNYQDKKSLNVRLKDLQVSFNHIHLQ